jgi:RHS repeat-associated protein
MTGASFVYDPLGRRVSKTIGGSTTSYLYDGVNPVQEGGANLLTGLGVDQYFTRTDGGGTRAFLTDALGSTLALADGTGAVQTEYTYEPFGKTTTSGATSSNSFQYTGRENDGTGLYYYRARYYSPEIQRFISEDPIEIATGDVNIYAYVGNNPVRWKDPWGLDKQEKNTCQERPFGERYLHDFMQTNEILFGVHFTIIGNAIVGLGINVPSPLAFLRSGLAPLPVDLSGVSSSIAGPATFSRLESAIIVGGARTMVVTPLATISLEAGVGAGTLISVALNNGC